MFTIAQSLVEDFCLPSIDCFTSWGLAKPVDNIPNVTLAKLFAYKAVTDSFGMIILSTVANKNGSDFLHVVVCDQRYSGFRFERQTNTRS